MFVCLCGLVMNWLFVQGVTLGVTLPSPCDLERLRQSPAVISTGRIGYWNGRTDEWILLFCLFSWSHTASCAVRPLASCSRCRALPVLRRLVCLQSLVDCVCGAAVYPSPSVTLITLAALDVGWSCCPRLRRPLLSLHYSPHRIALLLLDVTAAPSSFVSSCAQHTPASLRRRLSDMLLHLHWQISLK